MGEDQGRTATAAAIGKRGTPEGPTLLLVDDDAPLRRSLPGAWLRRGFIVYTAATLQGSLSLAHSIRPEYAVIDLRLEDGIGLELVRRLRELHAPVRILILTGYGNIAAVVAAVKAGAVDCLAKPVDADEVINALLGSTLRTPEARP